ncbi:MAG: hypothetical protein ACI9D0_000980 [Bacteroidia bacterium]|jgi:hypothetical protein
MNLALAARALVSHSKSLALASLVLSLAPSLALAVDDAPTTPYSSWACAHTVPVQSTIVLLPGHTCSCSGTSQTVQGEITFGGVTVGIGQAPPKKDLDGLLVCQSYIIEAGYDAYAPGGQTTVVQGDFIHDILVTSSCDKSDCGQALGFLWTTGDAECDETQQTSLGGHQSYKVTGRSCETPLTEDQGGSPSGAPTSRD